MKMKKSLALLSAVLCFSNAGVTQVDGLIGISIDWLGLDKGKNIIGKDSSESVKFKRSSAALYNILVGFLYNCGNGFRVGPEFSYGFANKKSRLECSENALTPAMDAAFGLLGNPKKLSFSDTQRANALSAITNTDHYNRKVRSVGTFNVKIGGALNSDVSVFALFGYTFANIKINRWAQAPAATSSTLSMEEIAVRNNMFVLLDTSKNKSAKPKKHGFSFGLDGAVKVAPNCSISARATYTTSIKLWRVGVAVVANF